MRGISIIACLVIALSTQILPNIPGQPSSSQLSQAAKYLIVMIGGGQGSNHIQALRQYTGNTPIYQTWNNDWVENPKNDSAWDNTLVYP